MRPRARLLTIVPVLLMTLLTLSCGGDGGSGPVAIASVTISPTAVTLTFVGETRTLTATVIDENGSPAQVAITWRSSNPTAVEVGADGTLTARGPGSASVTASAGGVTSAPATVAVDQQVTGVELDVTELSFSSLGETRTLSASAVDQGGTPVASTSVAWVTTNDNVATVTPTGLVTAVGNGNASIRATVNNVSGSVPVTVRQVAVTAERKSAAAVSFDALGRTAQIEIEARDALNRFIDDPNAVYSSDDDAVATVSPTGLVTATGNGQATISIEVDGVATAPVAVDVAQVATSVTVDPALLVLNEIGATGQVTATALDALDNAVEGAAFAWSSADQAIATVEPQGATVTVTGRAEGITTVSATSGAIASDPIEVFVGSGEVTALTSGQRIEGLAGPAGFQRFYRITVPAGAGELHVGTGGGSSFDGTGDGDLDLFLRFGELPTADFTDQGQLNSGRPANDENIEVLDPQAGDWFLLVDGFVDTNGSGPGYRDVTLTARIETDAQGRDIALAYVSQFTAAQRQAIRQAADRWELVLPTDLFGLWINVADVCGITGLPLSDLVDDLLIIVGLFERDGAGGNLAAAGPCRIRAGGGQDNLPIVGAMFLDVADLDALEASGQLMETALHEIGHVLGLGSLWEQVSPPLLQGGGTQDPFFNGPLAIQAFDDSGGGNYSGPKVPVENTGGDGTVDSHWRESVLDNELMTGFAEAQPGEKLSIITIQQFLDLGYPAVDVGQADAYTVPGGGGAAARAPQEGRPRGDDVLRPDLWQVGRDGEERLVRTGRGPGVRPVPR